MPDNTLVQIQQHRQSEQTYTGGGHPHTFVELYDGRMVQMLMIEPDILTFREDYYYNSADNNLYIKNVEWVNVDRKFESEDSGFVYYNNRAVKKMVNEPDPKNFGDKYYYSLISHKVFGKTLKWVKCTNL